MADHAHHDIDWAARLSGMRNFDALEREPLAAVAARLTADLVPDATVVDVGCGAGGMSAALARVLQRHGGGNLILVDAGDHMLAAARDAAIAAADPTVRVETVVADLGTTQLSDLIPEADLIWAGSVVHHLSDQQVAVNRLAGALRAGGCLAVAEGGLDTRCLPWDVGTGAPGLEHRLNAARDVWFEQLRATLPGVVRMSYGWTITLSRAGLADVSSFTYLIDHPAPSNAAVRDFAMERLTWLAEIDDGHISDADRDAVRLLLDPDQPEYLGRRDDVYLLSARTVHTGRRP